MNPLHQLRRRGFAALGIIGLSHAFTEPLLVLSQPHIPALWALNAGQREHVAPGIAGTSGQALFSQARDLAQWFKERGVNIHGFTMVIEETIHYRIHGGGPQS